MLKRLIYGFVLVVPFLSLGCGGGGGGSAGDANDPAETSDAEQMNDETGDVEGGATEE